MISPNNETIKELEIAETQTKSDDPLVHILWLVDGLDLHHRSKGKMGHNLGDTKRYVLAQTKALLTYSEKLFDPFDFVEPCEPDCSAERHAYHQGQWDMAIRIDQFHKNIRR